MPYTVAGSFTELLERLKLTDRQQEVVGGRIRHLRDFCGRRYELVRQPWAIGSFGRETIIRPERDIDVMVIFDDAYWGNYRHDSKRFLHGFRDDLNTEYGDTKVSSQGVAVRMALSEGLQVDVVPGFTAEPSGGFQIPNGAGAWQLTNPPYHDGLMERSNIRLASRLKPLVRLMKFWNLCNLAYWRSFHLELMVEAMWRGDATVPAWPNAVAETLRVAPTWAAGEFKEPWLGARLDGYLASDARGKLVERLRSDYATAQRALDASLRGDQQSAIASWAVVFHNGFPAYA